MTRPRGKGDTMAEVKRHDRILDPGDCVLVVVDVQEKLFPSVFEKELLEVDVARLIKAAMVMKVPILVTEQNPRGLGTTIPSIRKELGEHYRPIEKDSFSCWLAPAFRSKLAQMERGQILMAGIESHVCVEQTALDLCAEGYQVHIITDAVTSRTQRNQLVGFRKMESHGSVLTSTESAIFELLVRSGTPVFKELLPMLKEMK
jgi:nicotinamidase-related amidase